MKGPLVLVGLMGSGKTSVGRLLAARLGWTWVDLDAALERRYRRKVAQQFARDGEAVFRKREAEMLAELLRQSRQVLSTGGGVVLDPRNRARLKASACAYLQASPRVLAARLKGAQARKRPLLKGLEPQKSLERLARMRGPLYRDCARITVQAGRGGPKAVAERILGRMQELS